MSLFPPSPPPPLSSMLSAESAWKESAKRRICEVRIWWKRVVFVLALLSALVMIVASIYSGMAWSKMRSPVQPSEEGEQGGPVPEWAAAPLGFVRISTPLLVTRFLCSREGFSHVPVFLSSSLLSWLFSAGCAHLPLYSPEICFRYFEKLYFC